jgi:hypothetical protein
VPVGEKVEGAELGDGMLVGPLGLGAMEGTDIAFSVGSMSLCSSQVVS